MPSILDRQARINLAEIEFFEVPGLADPEFVRGLEGQGREAARAAVVSELQRVDRLERIEPHNHQVPHGDRSGVVIEPLLTVQWYCDAKTLAQPAIAAVEQGTVHFVPQQWENTFFAWMRDIQPWCISRQLWWGHRIPAWYAADGRVFVAETEAEALEQARAALGPDTALVQDEDVLDTWFSSALWPFSTLGWPDGGEILARHYPTDVLVTGFDIIFFWVARMMMMGLHVMGDVPFRTVVIHGLVRDERGQKMSKSKGNVIDPLALIAEYGADALRFAVCQLTGPGRDIKLGASRVAESRSFVTKLWNAARFCEMNGVAPVAGFDPAAVRAPLCRWLLDAANGVAAEAGAALETFRFDEYAAACYRFTWNVFCDWFVELSKPVFSGADGAEKQELRATAAHVLGMVLRLLHPATPFVTEALWDAFGYGPRLSLIRAAWPEAARVHAASDARAELDWVIRFITTVRTVRAEMNVPPSVKTPVLLRDASTVTRQRAADWLDAATRLARISAIDEAPEHTPAGSAQMVLDAAVLVMPLAELIDLAVEGARLRRDRDRVVADVAKLAAKLANADFVARAKPEIVDENRERLRRSEAELTRLEAALARLS